MKPTPSQAASATTGMESPVRERILGAAFHAFTEKGYAGTSTLEIATRAKVSKRELYALFGSKQAVLIACITTRAARMRLPPDMPEPNNGNTLAAALTAFGVTLMREVCHPAVVAMFRLAIAEAERSPEVARALTAAGRDPARAALAELLAGAQASGLLGEGNPVELAGEYLAFLWGDLLMRLLLRVAKPPKQDEIQHRARKATAALLQLHARAPVIRP